METSSSSSHNERNKEFDFKILEKVSEGIVDKLRYDEMCSPDLLDQFQFRRDVTGSQRYYTEPYKSAWGPMVEHSEFLTMPQTIIDQCSTVECATFMGLIPEINRAWITVDNKLYLWNYAKADEFDVYDSLADVIVSVAVSTPKPGIFMETVKYVLAIATPVEVVLLAVSCDQHCDKLRLIPTAYNLPSDNIAMFKLIGSQVGRIFMAGNDGNLYELDYSNSENPWAALIGGGANVTHKCQKINHFYWNWKIVNIVPPFLRSLAGAEEGSLADLMIDNVRHMLYTLSSTSVLSAFYLGAKDDMTSFIIKSFHIIEEARSFLLYNRNTPESSPKAEIFKDASAPGFNIVGMYPISPMESKKVHLMIILGNGIRIYLSLRVLYNAYYTEIPGPDSNSFVPSPTGIEVVYVRSPPSTKCLQQTNPSTQQSPTDLENWSVPTYSSSQPLSISNAFYSQGVLLMAQERGKQPDELWAIYEDMVTRSSSSTRKTDFHAALPNLREGISSALPTSMRGGVGTVYAIQESCSQIHYESACRIRTLYNTSSTPLANLEINNTISQQQRFGSYPQQASSTSAANAAAQSAAGNNGPQPYYNPSELPVTPAQALARAALPKGSCLGYERSNLDNVALLGELSTQHIPSVDISMQRKFLVLTNQGIHVLRKVRPVDILYHNISQVNAQSEDFSRYFLACFGPLQYCAMSVGLACGVPCDAGSASSSLDPLLFNSVVGSNRLDTIQQRAMATMLALTEGPSYKKVGAQSVLMDSSSSSGFKDSRLVLDGATHDFLKSSSHDGVYLALSRILRPIWLRLLVDKHRRLHPVFRDQSLINQIRNPLVQLKKILEGYYPVAVLSDPNKLDFLAAIDQQDTLTNHDLVTQKMHNQAQSNANPDKTLQQQAKNLENSSFNCIYRMISRCIQALSFIEIILSVERSWPQLIIEWTNLATSNFRMFVISPIVHESLKKITTDLIAAITKNPEKQHIADETIERLTKECYHFFSAGDRLSYEAAKIMDACHARHNRGEDSANVQGLSVKCVDLLLQSCKYWKSLECVNGGDSCELVAKCTALLKLGKVGRGGIVDLCFAAVENFKPKAAVRSMAVTFPVTFSATDNEDGTYGDDAPASFWDVGLYQGGTILNDKDCATAIQACHQCLVKHILSVGKVEVPLGDGMVPDPLRVNASVAALQNMSAMIDRAIGCSVDPAFHNLLYGELLAAGHQDVLLGIRTLFCEEFLTQTDPDLLYSYYDMHSQHLKASLLMTTMAKSDESIDIKTRIEYLAKAITSAEKTGVPAGGPAETGALVVAEDRSLVRHFVADNISELRDLMDVAGFQQRARTQLSEDYTYSQSAAKGPSESQREALEKMGVAVNRLQTRLLGIMELFHEICMPYRLWDVALMLLNTAKVDDDDLVAKLWRSLIYRIVPETGSSIESATFLAYKRNSDLIDTYERYQQFRHVSFENAQQWLPALESKLVQLGRELLGDSDSPRSSTFPVLVILEEVEELISTLTACDVPTRRGITGQLCYDIGMSHGSLIEAYMEIFDRWAGKATPDKLLQILSSSSLALLHWSRLAAQQSTLHTGATRDLAQAVRSGRLRGWLEKLRRHISALSGRQLSAKSRELLENTSNEFYEVQQRVTELTWL